MPDRGGSFLPRIQSVFYAVFDVKHGPRIDYQVPEDLIVSSGSLSVLSTDSSSVPLTPSVELPSPDIQPLYSQSPSATASNHGSNTGNGALSRNSSASMVSPVDPRPSYRNHSLLQDRSGSVHSRALFNFDDIHKYVIPPSALCGRLVICSTKDHRIIGFPVALKGRRYERNFFRYNICFVFERGADLSCYEPIVRKVSRVMTACEVGLPSLILLYLACISTAGRVPISFETIQVLSYLCNSRTVIRGFEFLRGNIHFPRPVQLDRTQNIPFLSQSSTCKRLDGPTRSY